MEDLTLRIEGLRAAIQDKNKIAHGLCEAATATVKSDIKDLQASLDDCLHHQAVNNGQRFEEIIEKIAEMQRISMRLKIFHNYDDRFQVSHHVKWIQLRDPESDEDKYYSDWWHYSDDDGKPLPDRVDDALKQSRETLARFESES